MHQELDRMVPQWMARWLPAGATTGELKEQVRSLITVLVLAFNLLFCFFSVLYTELFLAPLLHNEIHYARYVVYPCLLLYLIATICLYALKRSLLARWLIIVNIYLSCTAGVMLTGGYTVSPISSLVVLPAIFSFVLLGARQGVVCAAIVSSTVLVACVLEMLGFYSPLQAVPTQLVWQSLTLFVPLVAMAMVVFSLLFYEQLTQRLQKDLQRQRNQFHWEATHDALTGLPNRPEFYTRLQLAMANAERTHQPLALVFFDLDGFKPINDTYGHDAGDMVLQVVARRLDAIMRDVDTIARLGGDEFAIILQGTSRHEADLDGIMQKILRAVSEPIMVAEQQVAVGASLGVAFYEAGCSQDAFCKQADTAMYSAKEHKNTWRLWQPTPRGNNP